MLELNVCVGSACHIKGSYNVINAFQQMIEEHSLSDEIDLKAVFCLKQCMKAVAVRIGDEGEIYSVSGASAREFFEKEVLQLVEKKG